MNYDFESRNYVFVSHNYDLESRNYELVSYNYDFETHCYDIFEVLFLFIVGNGLP